MDRDRQGGGQADRVRESERERDRQIDRQIKRQTTRKSTVHKHIILTIFFFRMIFAVMDAITDAIMANTPRLIVTCEISRKTGMCFCNREQPSQENGIQKSISN